MEKERINESRKFRTIVADPPWDREQKGRYGAVKHYGLMPLEQIKAMPVPELAAKDAHLWLWTTNAGIKDALEVIAAWGFTYRSMFHWIKPRLGLGVYLRNCSETCLFATRGKAPVKVHNQMNWGFFPTGEHSEKPREFASIVERVSEGPYLELFCRKRPASNRDWCCWGNECEGGSDIVLPGYPVPQYSFEEGK